LLICLASNLAQALGSLTRRLVKGGETGVVDGQSALPSVRVVGPELQIIPLESGVILQPHTQQHTLLQYVPCAEIAEL
jgi:hypothetical protein